MRILMLEWDSFGQEYITEEFENAGCEIVKYPWPFGKENMRENDKLCAELTEALKTYNYHFVFSLNFYPVAAKACYECGTKYVAWVYDTPFLLLYSEHLIYCTNQVYLFDKSLYQEFVQRGYTNVFYLPMAAPVSYYDSLDDMAKKAENYKAELSFVGSTYQEARQNFYKYLENVSDYTRGYLKAIIQSQKDMYGYFIMEELLNETVLQDLKKVCPIDKGEDEWETDGWIYANYFLARELTGKQRVEQLSRLAEHIQVKLYTPGETPELIRVKNCGPVDYVNQMPLVFKQSKINLNMTLRSIHSGIPLRAMDIMGCGGFLLTNYQEDFLEYFEPDVDYVYYADEKDLMEKAAYYLEHEEERKKIAANGYQKVKEAHTYAHRIRTILENVMGKEEETLNDAISAVEEIHPRGTKWWFEEINLISMDMLAEETERRMLQLEAERSVLFHLQDAVVQWTNCILRKRSEEGYEQFTATFSKNVVSDLHSIFPMIYYIRVFSEIYLLEKENHQPHFITNISDCTKIQEVYQQIVKYLRRIERDLPQDLQQELFLYMKQNNITLYVINVILEYSLIYDKEKVRNGFMKLLQS